MDFDKKDDVGGMFQWGIPMSNQPEKVDDDIQENYVEEIDEPMVEDIEIKQAMRQKVTKGSKNKDEIKKFKYNKTAKLSQEEADQLECVKDAFGYSTDSEAIRWFILKAWEIYGVDIEKTAKKIRKIRAQQ